MPNPFNLKCPNCGNDTTFSVTSRYVMSIHGATVHGVTANTWEYDDEMSCDQCSYEGRVKAFKADDDAGT